MAGKALYRVVNQKAVLYLRAALKLLPFDPAEEELGAQDQVGKAAQDPNGREVVMPIAAVELLPQLPPPLFPVGLQNGLTLPGPPQIPFKEGPSMPPPFLGSSGGPPAAKRAKLSGGQDATTSGPPDDREQREILGSDSAKDDSQIPPTQDAGIKRRRKEKSSRGGVVGKNRVPHQKFGSGQNSIQSKSGKAEAIETEGARAAPQPPPLSNFGRGNPTASVTARSAPQPPPIMDVSGGERAPAAGLPESREQGAALPLLPLNSSSGGNAATSDAVSKRVELEFAGGSTLPLQSLVPSCDGDASAPPPRNASAPPPRDTSDGACAGGAGQPPLPTGSESGQNRAAAGLLKIQASSAVAVGNVMPSLPPGFGGGRSVADLAVPVQQDFRETSAVQENGQSVVWAMEGYVERSASDQGILPLKTKGFRN
jgi:hypothetical protein